MRSRRRHRRSCRRRLSCPSWRTATFPRQPDRLSSLLQGLIMLHISGVYRQVGGSSIRASFYSHRRLYTAGPLIAPSFNDFPY